MAGCGSSHFGSNLNHYVDILTQAVGETSLLPQTVFTTTIFGSILASAAGQIGPTPACATSSSSCHRRPSSPSTTPASEPRALRPRPLPYLNNTV